MERSFDYNSPIDITLKLDENTIIYPGDPKIEIRKTLQISKGDSLNMSEIITLGLHVGTHIDFPSHFLDHAKCMDHYSVKSFMGMAVVIDICNTKTIRPEDLQKFDIPRNIHIFLKTDNSRLLAFNEFKSDYCYLSEEASNVLKSYAPSSVGIDYYSLDPATSTSFDAHKIFAMADIPVYVCLDLRKVEPGTYYFIGLPLSFSEVEASPVRAVLFPLTS